MEKLLKEYLETAYDSPFEVEVENMRTYKSIFVYCGNELIIRGTINESKDWSYVSWVVPVDTWNKMNKYIPTVDPNDYKDIVSWVRKKCKKQGIPLLGHTYYNLK